MAETSTILAYEDFHVGRRFLLGPRTVTAEEIVAFAGEFDAQPMHLDEAAGRASILGGLSASGWHTTALLMRMITDSFLLASTSEGGPGVDEIAWKRPVLAGDTLAGETEVTSRRLSASRPGLGLIGLRHTLQNQRGETVLVLTHAAMMRQRAEPAR